jgi:hypothetical protein
MQTHVKVVAAFFFVFGALKLCAALFVQTLLGLLAGYLASAGGESNETGAAVVGSLSIVLAIYCLAYAIPALLTGWGLLTRRSWARILAIVLAAFGLIEIPFGTLFGIYALWVLFNKDTEAMFAAPVAAPNAS